MRALLLATLVLTAAVVAVPAATAYGPPSCLTTVAGVGIHCFDYGSHEYCPIYTDKVHPGCGTDTA